MTPFSNIEKNDITCFLLVGTDIGYYGLYNSKIVYFILFIRKICQSMFWRGLRVGCQMLGGFEIRDVP